MMQQKLRPLYSQQGTFCMLSMTQHAGSLVDAKQLKPTPPPIISLSYQQRTNLVAIMLTQFEQLEKASFECCSRLYYGRVKLGCVPGASRCSSTLFHSRLDYTQATLGRHLTLLPSHSRENQRKQLRRAKSNLPQVQRSGSEAAHSICPL